MRLFVMKSSCPLGIQPLLFVRKFLTILHFFSKKPTIPIKKPIHHDGKTSQSRLNKHPLSFEIEETYQVFEDLFTELKKVA